MSYCHKEIQERKEEREQIRQINRSLLKDIMKCPEFDIQVFEEEILRWKKHEKIKKRLFKFLESQDFSNQSNEDIAEKLFDYLNGNDWLDEESIDCPSLREIS